MNPGLLSALETIYVPNSRPLAESANTGDGGSCQHGHEFVTLNRAVSDSVNLAICLLYLLLLTDVALYLTTVVESTIEIITWLLRVTQGIPSFSKTLGISS